MTMRNTSEEYVVLANSRNEYCLWAAFMDVPSGWEVQYGPDVSDNCLEYVRNNWSIN
ncbi:MbtH family NRPS accessory protein [Kocuria sp. SL71]|uniref:MbtH family NRPS accessory protein n=1 Tax=Kocuria sp. SL71 TaxID=2995151 RepID=UPI003FA35265